MKTVKVLLPDYLHDQLLRKASEAGFDLSAYILALLAEGSAPRTNFPQVTTPMPQSVSRPVSAESLPLVLPSTPKSIRPSFKQKPGGTKRAQTNIAVVIRWDLIGKGNSETLHAPDAVATLVDLVSRFHKVFGIEALQKMADLRVSRGPFITRYPSRDYVNGASRNIYSNHKIPNTDYYILTQTSTDQKIQNLKELLQHLKLPSNLFEITKHLKS